MLKTSLHTLQLTRFFPIIAWLKTYQRQELSDDLFAGIITAILLVPQGIAYAILAGLPPQLGLYASILPPIAYAVFGTSRTLSVGPVSIAAIMIAGTLSAPEVVALGDTVTSALLLSTISGVLLLVMALLRLGGLVNFISHPVLAGFTSGAALLIIGSQIPPLLGLSSPECGYALSCYQHYVSTIHLPTLWLSLTSLTLLIFFGQPISFLLKKTQLPLSLITAISKCGPLLTVILASVTVAMLDLTASHVAVVGQVPAGFPRLSIDFIAFDKLRVLFPFAAFIALIAYVESVAIAKVTANLRGQKISPNQELIALGMANLASAISCGMPVAGGFSRTMVNFSAGARTQMAMLIAASFLAIAVIFFSPWFANIPKAALAAIILMAVYRLVRIRHIVHTWQYDSADGKAETATLLGVLLFGIEEGIMVGMVLTLFCYLRRASHPHIAIVGRVPETEHFRNVNRHSVETWHHLLLVRIDESITFTNINFIEAFLESQLQRRPDIRHIILIFTSVSDIDTTALEALELFNQAMQAKGISLNIAEAKGPVLDKLQKTDFVEALKPGKVYFRTEDAVKALG
ncbi:MAG: sulfate permease [Methylovulum sp.]|jgi:SulP family sulfate permease|nr:sulfate permease [Methylovulum sp.]